MAGCASNEQALPSPDLQPSAISSAIKGSCPEGTRSIPPETISLTVTPLDWDQNPSKIGKAFGPLQPVALYALESPDSRLGGLSGLDFIDSDTLALVSDFGNLVWLNIDPQTSEPDNRAMIAGLRDANGELLDSKKTSDSEGVSWNGEALLISFEREHRVLAYDILGCGSAARGIEVVSFAPDGFEIDKSIEENSGLEGLATRSTTDILAGLETNSGGSPVGLFGEFAETGFSTRLPSPELTMLTGLDLVEVADGPDRLYSIFRSYDPLRGNRIAIAVTEVSQDGAFGETRQLAIWGKEIVVDNFEGISVIPINEATDRIFIVSDDNFSDRQQTLLGVFDYAHQ